MTDADRDDEVAGVVADVVDEFRARRAAGQGPDPAEYAARHPGAAGAIRRVLGRVRALPGPAPLAPSVAGGPPPRELGDFRIVREVGRGGMGVVYEAEPLSLGRRVALKVLPFAAVLDPRHLQRFRNEARAAAGLDHPHAVKVYAVGEDRGVHFIALQFVDGRPLSDLIRERRGEVAGAAPAGPHDPTRAVDPDATPPGSRTPADAGYLRRVAEWGAQAADALEHAHGLGVVHRDVKPANLLADGRGCLFVADFGLARVGRDPGVTGTGDLLGTVRYMSPEQARAKHDLVDHRSDIYSLGATLYELLTLAPAFPGDDPRAVLESVVTTDPVPPRRLDRRVPKDLETVVLKAMDKDPARRYATAGDLAADLRRFLAGEPVVARRSGRWDRARRWVRRNPAAATLLAVVALAAAGGAAGLLWHNARLREAADRERGQAGRADEKTRWARRAVNDMYTRLAEEWLADAHLSEVQREFLTRALEFYEESVRDAGAVEDRLEVARTYRRMAHLRGGLSRNAEALADLRVAARIAAEFPGSDECRLESARAAVDLGRLLTIMDQTAEGRTELRRAVPLIEGLHRARPDDPEYRADLANALFLSAVSPREPGQPDRGMEELARAREQAAWLVAHRPGTVRYEELLVRVNSALGGRLVDAGQTADGEHCLLEARDRLQGLMTKAPTRPVLRRRLATLLEHLADLRSGRGTTGRPSGWPVRRSNSGAGSTTSTRTGPPTGKRWPRHKPSTGAP